MCACALCVCVSAEPFSELQPLPPPISDTTKLKYACLRADDRARVRALSRLLAKQPGGGRVVQRQRAYKGSLALRGARVYKRRGKVSVLTRYLAQVSASSSVPKRTIRYRSAPSWLLACTLASLGSQSRSKPQCNLTSCAVHTVRTAGR